MCMKTQLAPVSSELAAVLGAEGRQIRYISVPATARRGRVVVAPDATSALAKIEAALDRLEQGTFGLCIGCGGEICLQRLDHDPSVPQCQECEEGFDPKPHSAPD